MSEPVSTKPSDIRVVLLNAQDVIDAAVQTVTATRQTQEVLEENIRVTDKKIGVHNVDPESHEDIRRQLQNMPSVIGDPIVSGPSSAESGVQTSWTLSASPAAIYVGTISISKFLVRDADGGTLAELTAEDGVATFQHTFTGDRNSTTNFTVQAFGGTSGHPDDFSSAIITHNLTITQHLPPNMDEMTCTLPEIISEGQTYIFRIGNITDQDNDLENVVISCSDVHLTFNQTTIQQNTDYTLTVDEDYNGPADIPITFTAHDTFGLSNSKQVTVHLNALPVVSGFAHTFPTYPNPNTSYTFKVSGVTDPDDESTDLKCALVANNPAVTFIKDEDIALNEDITCQVGEIASGTAISITCTFSDPHGGETPATISATVNTPPDTSSFVVTKPDRVAPGSEVNISFAGATDVNGEAVTYEIVNTNPVLTFGKTTNIAADEQVSVEVASSAEHGQNYTFSVIAIDASNGRTTVSVSLTVNTLPNVTTVTATLPTYVAPGQTYQASVSGATDVDSQSLTYTITSDNENVVLSNATNIAAGTNFSITTPTAEQLARGQSFNLIVTVSDGLETSTTSVTATINQLAETDTIKTTLPATMQGGSDNSVDFSISGGSDPEGQAFTYNIVDASDGLHFTKTSGITAGESITLTADKVSDDSVLTFNITITDATNETTTTTKEVSITVQAILYTAAPTITSPSNGAELEYEPGVTITWTEFATAVDLS